jgi:hypothetical protein
VRIENSYRMAAAGSRATPRSGDGGSFSLPSASAAGSARPAAGILPSQSLDALLALQAVNDPLEGRRRQVKRGRGLLDALDGLRADLLTGRLGEGRLNQLLAILGQARESSIPGLDALLDDIELRARVELAKAGRFT